jgi:hypothetical protein
MERSPHEQQPQPRSRRSSGCLYAFVGGLIGGFVIPVILFIGAAVVLRDTGGPLFWPLISIPLGLIGLAIGWWAHAEFRKRKE